MTGWIIFGSIVFFLVWLFTRSVTVDIRYGERLDIKVRFLFVKLYPTKPKKKKPPKKVKAGKNEKNAGKAPENALSADNAAGNAENTDMSASEDEKGKYGGRSEKAAKKPKKKLPVDLEQIVDYVKSASGPIKRLFRKIRFSDVYLDYTVGSDDAAKTALKYGGLCAAVYPLLEWMKAFFTVKVKRISIKADFSRESDDISARCKIKLRVSTAIGCALWLAVRILKTYSKYSSKSKTTKAKPARA